MTEQGAGEGAAGPWDEEAVGDSRAQAACGEVPSGARCRRRPR